MPLDVEDRPELAARERFTQRAYRWPEAPVMADGEDDPGRAAGAEHPCGVRVRQRQRLSRKNLLSRSRPGDHLRRMQRMRRRQQDRADRVIGEDRIEIGGQVEIMPGTKFLCRCHVRLDGANDFQPWVVSGGFDQIAAPAAETGNGGADHRNPR